jgi:hypothetical protein
MQRLWKILSLLLLTIGIATIVILSVLHLSDKPQNLKYDVSLLKRFAIITSFSIFFC